MGFQLVIMKEMNQRVKKMIEVKRGDISQLDSQVDAIVNAANRRENQKIDTQVIVFDDTWLSIFTNIQTDYTNEND